MKKVKFIQIKDGEWFFPRHRSWKMKCCKCGLVHSVNFQVIDRKTKTKETGKAVRMQAFRLDK